MSRSLEKYRVVVLCEDRTHYHFIRGFLIAQGIRESRQITLFKGLPEGRQAGEQFVRENFAEGFRKYASSDENVIFVVIQDIDQGYKTPESAKQEIYATLQEDERRGIHKADKLLLVFPKRNIETWFEWLSQESQHNAVDESTDFKLKHKEAKPRKMGERASKLVDMHEPDICGTAPSSMLHACKGFADLCEALA